MNSVLAERSDTPGAVRPPLGPFSFLTGARFARPVSVSSSLRRTRAGSAAPRQLPGPAAGCRGAGAWPRAHSSRGAGVAGRVLLLDNHRGVHARDPDREPRRGLASLWGERRVVGDP